MDFHQAVKGKTQPHPPACTILEFLKAAKGETEGIFWMCQKRGWKSKQHLKMVFLLGIFLNSISSTPNEIWPAAHCTCRIPHAKFHAVGTNLFDLIMNRVFNFHKVRALMETATDLAGPPPPHRSRIAQICTLQ